jgi:hypothetical protein
MASATVAVRIADLPQVKATIDEATQTITRLTADRDALGQAAAAFCRANVAWAAARARDNDGPELAGYWHTYDHLIFTLRRFGYLGAAEDGGGSSA